MRHTFSVIKACSFKYINTNAINIDKGGNFMDNKNFEDIPQIKYVNEYKKFGDIFRFKKFGERTYFDKLLLQTFITLIIVAMLLLINKVDTVLANNISKGVKEVVSWNISLNTAMDTFKNIKTIIPNTKKTLGIEEDNSSITFIMPVDGVITSPFGERIHPVFNTTKLHTGIDIDAEIGTPIKSSTKGTVKEVGEDEYNGKFVRVTAGKYEVAYAHCFKTLVKKGQKIAQGDIIAEVGDTGVVSGPHLHFEIQEDGQSVDPLEKLNSASIQ
jgi:murein DD-endopeptidase MepM/ murein hydrolase activator NlpD